MSSLSSILLHIPNRICLLTMKPRSNCKVLLDHAQDSDPDHLATRWATNEDWTTQKALLRRLYVHEGKTLAEIMDIMEISQGFKAS